MNVYYIVTIYIQIGLTDCNAVLAIAFTMLFGGKRRSSVRGNEKNCLSQCEHSNPMLDFKKRTAKVFS